MESTYGSITPYAEDFKSTTPAQYSFTSVNEPLFSSSFSPECPDGSTEVLNNVTNQPLGELNVEGSHLFRRR